MIAVTKQFLPLLLESGSVELLTLSSQKSPLTHQFLKTVLPIAHSVPCCVFILYKYSSGGLVAKLYPTLMTSWTVKPLRLLCPWDFPGKNTGVSCDFLLQGIFLTQGSNPGNPALQAVSCIAG